MGIEAQRGSAVAGIDEREPSPSRLRSSNTPSAEITTTVKKLSERFQSSAKELSALSQQIAENPNSALQIRHLRESLEEETKKLRKLTNDSQLTEQQRNQLLAPFRAQLAAILVEEARALAATANS